MLGYAQNRSWSSCTFDIGGHLATTIVNGHLTQVKCPVDILVIYLNGCMT